MALIENTAALRDVLAAVENLPERGGGGDPVLQETSVTPSSNVLSLSVPVEGDPLSFAVCAAASFNASSTRCVVAVAGSLSGASGVYAYQSSNKNWCQLTPGNYTAAYANGQLTVTSAGASTGGYFRGGTAYTVRYLR